MYTLILITALLPGHYTGGGSISSSSVSGFSTEQACTNAMSKFVAPSGGYSGNNIKVIFSCVKMDV